jgi:hypothetical protein
MSDLSFLLSATVANVDYELYADSLPQSSLEFLLRYGFRQYLQDSVAMSKDDMAEIKAECDDSGEDYDSELAGEKSRRVNARLEKIHAGTCSERSVTRDPLEAEIKRVALVALKALAKAQQKKLPKDQKARNAMLARFIEAKENRARFEAIAKENLAQQRAAAEEIDDSVLDM